MATASFLTLKNDLQKLCECRFDGDGKSRAKTLSEITQDFVELGTVLDQAFSVLRQENLDRPTRVEVHCALVDRSREKATLALSRAADYDQGEEKNLLESLSRHWRDLQADLEDLAPAVEMQTLVSLDFSLVQVNQQWRQLVEFCAQLQNSSFGKIPNSF